MVAQALIVSLVNFLVCWIDNILGTQIFIRPLVVSTITGALLGDLHTGIVMGAALEAMYMGFSSIGGSIPVDPNSGSVLAVSFAILTKADMDTALALSLPIASAVNLVSLLVVTVSSMLEPFFTRLINEGKMKQFSIAHQVVNAVLMTLPYYIVIFVGIAFGIQHLESFIALLPSYVIHGMEVAGGILPGVGFAILLNMIWTKEIAVFFFAGFVFSRFMKLPTFAIVIMAATIALSVYFFANQPAPAVAVPSNDDKEDFFQ